MNKFLIIALVAFSSLLTGCAADPFGGIKQSIVDGRERSSACHNAYEAERAALIEQRRAVVAELERVKSGQTSVENPEVTILKARRNAYVTSMQNANYEMRTSLERKVVQIDQQLTSMAASAPAKPRSVNEAADRVATIRRLNYQIENINNQLDWTIQRNVRGYCSGISVY